MGAVSAATGERRLIVVGSQSVHGQVKFVPEIVLRSIEVDIYISPATPASKLIDSQFGPDSAYCVANGVYADTLGPGIVAPPPGWEECLVPIAGETGTATHWSLEKHDAAATKLIAGRDKDMTFIASLIDAEAIDFAVFLDRASLMRTTPFSGALHSRLTKLVALFRERRWNHLLPPVERLLASL